MVAQSNRLRIVILLAAHRVGGINEGSSPRTCSHYVNSRGHASDWFEDGSAVEVYYLDCHWEGLVMAMQNPPHPGGIVRRQCLEPLGLSVTRAARGLGVTRQALSELVNERTGVSVDMAIRLSKAFGSTPETWLGMQMACDLWQAREHADRIEVESFVTT